jgi:hypothetical protein
MKSPKIVLGFIAAFSLSAFALQASATTIIPTAGKTEVQLSNEFVGALVFLEVKPGAIGPGTLSKKAVASFPINTGAIEGLTGEVDHSGGLSLSAGNTRVVLNSFIIDGLGSRPVLTGIVIANGNIVARVPLFDVDTSGVQVVAKGKRVTMSNVKLTLSAEAADALNQLFGVSAFTEKFPVGTAVVKVTNSKFE